MESPLHVLVVDASAVVRQDLPVLLRDAGGFEVTVAASGPAALQKLQRARPDVVLLGLEPSAPEGLALLRELVAAAVPVVACAKARVRDEALAREALRAGAADIVHWPQVGLRAHLPKMAGALTELLRAAGGRRSRASAPRGETPEALQPPRATRVWKRQVIAVGASTGGPSALRGLLSALPADAPGLLVVQHIPEPFASTFTLGLAEVCRIQVRRAEQGDVLSPGTALLAPGDQHLRLVESARGYAVQLSDEAPFHFHRPSVDLLFHSVARVAGHDAVGVLLTGMGDDGARGLAAMRRAGAATFAQDADTSVVYGMPRAAVLLGAVEASLPLEALPEAILDAASRRGGAERPSREHDLQGDKAG